MMFYIVQIIAFQLLFLVIYDFFLKKETFFNWNRFYLLFTPLLSLGLPFIKLESLQTTAPETFVFLLPEVTVSAQKMGEGTMQNTVLPNWGVWQWLFLAGCILSFIWFAYKLIQILHLKRKGKIHYFKNYTRVEVEKENTAFSFFKNIFIGSAILQKEHSHIIEHELIHIKERHSWDLLFFELLRIIFWFNPLVYVYQNRITELHEFIADAKTVNNNKKEHYKLLLQEAFQTENISFINQFFNHSLIKKRIVMLQKSKSKKVLQLKYLSLVPMVLGMLLYTSCEREDPAIAEQKMSIEDQVQELEVSLQGNKEALTPELKERILSLTKTTPDVIEVVDDGEESNKIIEVIGDVPYTKIAMKPRFKDCSDIPENQQFDCFKQQIDKHVRATFKYPEEAQANKEQGRVYINFLINTDGSVDVINHKGPTKALSEEAIRIIEALPTFIPGKDANGKAVPVSFAYPIVFKLN
ncbi:M56 family metallopeptidase [Galbibacter sp. PAP.153]|uniref:M56 family metallopeptidase n=1 Tax=Galbibacter sp. PAP.153 TaxID=3104623 RepID=UPI00300AE58C